MDRLFGKDGVKGIANTQLTCKVAFEIGRAVAVVSMAKSGFAPRILVGRDTRISGHMLESALVAGICSMGAQAECVGVIPSPAIAYLVKKYKMDAGISVSASHKPMEYNGIKVFDSDGYKVSSEVEDRIEAYVKGNVKFPEPKIGAELGRVSRSHTALRDYVDFVKSTIGADLSDIKVAIDCANGAAFECAKLCFKELGADVEMINNVPTGKNINDNCGSAHTDFISGFICKTKCDFGIAMDGDGDHLVACDEKGNIISGEKVLEICKEYLEDQGDATDGLVTGVCLARVYKTKGMAMSELAFGK